MVSGEYSWVDPLGTRHTVVYRADEDGFKILETREEKGFVKVDTPDQIRLKKNKRKQQPVQKNKGKKKKIQKLTVRVPKTELDGLVVRGARGRKPRGRGRTPRRRKLIRVVKRPRLEGAINEIGGPEPIASPGGALFQPVPFADPATTQVVDLRTVPQRIVLPTATASDSGFGGAGTGATGVERPIKLQRNLFFVPLKFPSDVRTAAASQAQHQAAELRQEGDKTVVVLRGNRKGRPINLPRAKVLKNTVQKVVHTKKEEEDIAVSVKNRHIDPKSFRTTMLKPKNVQQEPESHAVPEAVVPAAFLPNPPAPLPAITRSVLRTNPPASRVVQGPLPSPPVGPSLLPGRNALPPVLHPISPPAHAAPLPFPLSDQPSPSLPPPPPPRPVLPIGPSIRFLPVGAEGDVQQQEDVPAPPVSRPVIRFISLPLHQQQEQLVTQNSVVSSLPAPPPSPGSLAPGVPPRPQPLPSPNVRLIPFATLPHQPGQHLEPILPPSKEAQNEEESKDDASSHGVAVFGPRLPTLAEIGGLAQPTPPLAPPPLIRFESSDALVSSRPPPPPPPLPQEQNVHLGVQPQYNEVQQQQPQPLLQQQQPLQQQQQPASPFLVQVHPVPFSGGQSPFLRVFHPAQPGGRTAPVPFRPAPGLGVAVAGVSGGPFPVGGPSRVSFRSPTISYEY